jgi:hypothetical protein|tara:strand:- start:44 stop:280 length:237 start_codon:yes stop_codon:yes gene_type:complete
MSVYVEQAMQITGINRTEIIAVCTYLVRTRQAASASDALRRLEAGEFAQRNLQEEMIQSLQVELPRKVNVDPDLENND